MLVRFESSETGELLMYAEFAGELLRALGKPTTARGSFTQGEMVAAATLLRAAVARASAPVVDDDDEETPFMDKPVSLSQRAWPFIDMLERSAKGDARANIVWQAAADF